MKAGPNSDARTFYYHLFLLFCFDLLNHVFGLMFSALFRFENEAVRLSFVFAFCFVTQI